MALLSAVTEHNYQADPFSKLTLSLCLCRFIPLSVCHSALCAVCFNAHLSIPIIPISPLLCVSVYLRWSVWLRVFTLFYFSLYSPLQQAFSLFLFALPTAPSLPSFSSNLLQVFFSDSSFHLSPSVLASALCSSFLGWFFFLSGSHVAEFSPTKLPLCVPVCVCVCVCVCAHLTCETCVTHMCVCTCMCVPTSLLFT